MEYLTINSCQVRGLNELYLKYFGYKEDGCFIEVGAADGISWSNTYGLYKAGWRGLMYEPDINSYLKCVENMKEFPKVKVFPLAVGKEVGKIKLYAAGLGGSTVSEEYLEAIKLRNGWNPTGEYVVDLTTLNKELNKEKILPGEIDVISIDTEGNEPDVLYGFNIKHWKPTMVIVEAHEHYPDIDRPKTFERVNSYFDKHGYKKIYCDEVNNIYVPSELD